MKSVFLGYDPGGNNAHGVAAIQIDDEGHPDVRVASVATVEVALAWFSTVLAGAGTRAAIGIDTLTVWSTGTAGWRPADRCLRAAYPAVANSVASSNSLFGAMAVNGMSVALELRARAPHLVISETHPKVLHYALATTKHDFALDAIAMTARACAWVGADAIHLKNDHEWDALVSAYAVREGVEGRWTTDLHALPARAGETLVRPAGPTRFFWPSLPLG